MMSPNVTRISAIAEKPRVGGTLTYKVKQMNYLQLDNSKCTVLRYIRRWTWHWNLG